MAIHILGTYLTAFLVAIAASLVRLSPRLDRLLIALKKMGEMNDDQDAFFERNRDTPYLDVPFPSLLLTPQTVGNTFLYQHALRRLNVRAVLA